MRAFLITSCLAAAVVVACGTTPRGSVTGTGGGSAISASTGAGSGANAATSASTSAATATSAGSGGAPGTDAGAGGSGDDGGLPSVFGPVPDGGVFVQFVKTDRTTYFDTSQQMTPTGSVTFGDPNPAASDNNVASLTRTGGQAPIGTDGAEEIVSNRAFTFGTFRYRLALAQCASTEEVVNGPFTYFNDGSLAPDGLVINREVDIEILCGEPWLINLTIWTEYTDDAHFKNQSRVVDTRTGTVYVYANDQFGDQTGTEHHPELVLPGWPEAATFYEMGFTWASDHLAYFMVMGATTVTLWEATDATRIPQAPMEQHFNIWAPGDHWSDGMTAPPPANDATLTLDWWRYDPQ